jgi:hypothetical protein
MIEKAISITLIAMSMALPAQAAIGQETAVQRLDSINADPKAGQTLVQQVYQLILKMVDRWNNHDLDGYMQGFWKSDDLLAVLESEVHWGWSDLYNSYARGYPDRNLMGKFESRAVTSPFLSRRYGYRPLLVANSSAARRLTSLRHRYHAIAKIYPRMADYSEAH